MNIEKLPQEILDRAGKLGVTKITISFEGGNDEGIINVSTDQGGYEFESDIQEWAESAYHYSGAGEGIPYGDEIVYDLTTKKAKHTEWCMSRSETEGEEVSF